jgi:CheY-like chemotaxis protein
MDSPVLSDWLQHGPHDRYSPGHDPVDEKPPFWRNLVNVLFIEDDRMNRRVVRDMLDVAGATMIEAESAEQGLALLGEEAVDMVLVDLRMPGMDGLTAIRHIRARADAKGALPIIVVTADTAIDLRERCLAAGADDVIFKPVAMDALFDAMGRLLAERDDDGMI